MCHFLNKFSVEISNVLKAVELKRSCFQDGPNEVDSCSDRRSVEIYNGGVVRLSAKWEARLLEQP